MFTRLARDIMVAVREGGGDVNFNAALRLAVDKAKVANMPKDNIERAIKRSTGELAGGTLEEVTYEAYAPHGVAVLIQCLTDNRNRTLSHVRAVFNKNGGNMAEQGAVSWMFDTKGYITLAAGQMDSDDIFLIAADAGAEDVEFSDETVEIYTPPTELHTVVQTLEEVGLKVEEAELSQIAQNEIELPPKDTISIMNIIELLEELDDVDKVYSNLNFSDEALAILEAA
jgi:YebC/PmpR family DNA-binding regulatory protein